MEPLWRIALFDGPRLLTPDGTEVRRFRSQRVAALLAYLCLHLGRDCPREELVEALWPDEDPQVTANRLRVSLTSLRHQLELPGMPLGSVLDASRAGYVRLRSESVWCDVPAFEKALKQGNEVEAARLACGALLPGFYDEWILTERERLEALRTSLPSSSASEHAHVPAPIPAAPAVRPSGTPRRLPVYLTSFVGRERERDTVLAALATETTRLVTLTGLGGNGKTRLSVEVARSLSPDWSVWFIPLADLWQGERLGEALRTSLELPTALEPLAQLIGFLEQHDKPVLVLDNLEQIVLRAAPFLRELLERVPQLRLLVTSRRRLEIAGESEVLLQPLRTSAESAPTDTLAELAQNPAVRLFLDRASSVRPDFTLTVGNQEAICGLCQLLEGIPLGLELAASRTASLAPAQLLERLKAHWDAFEEADRRGKGKKEERHRSLRAVIEWSVALLPAESRRLFIQLAYFSGGATLDAIEEICQTPFALDTLTRLRASSLLSLTEQGGEVRFSMLEVLRQWAAEQLPLSERVILGERHGAWFERLIHTTFAEAGRRTERRGTERLESELANIRQALVHSCEEGHERFVAMAEQLTWFWETQGYAKEGREYLQTALTLTKDTASEASIALALAQLTIFQGELNEALTLTTTTLEKAQDQVVRASLHHARAFALFRLGRLPEALATVQEALTLLPEPGQELAATRFWTTQGAILRDLSRFEDAKKAMELSITFGRACGAGRALAGALNNLAALLYILKQEGVEPLFAEALELYQALDMRSGVAVIHMNSAVMASRREDWDEAHRHARQAILLLRQMGHRRHLASALSTLGQILIQRNQLSEARACLQEALQMRLMLGNPHSLFVTLGAASLYFLKNGQPQQAALFLGISQAYLDEFGQTLPPDETEERTQQLQAVEASIPQSEFTHYFEQGHTLGKDAREKQIALFLNS